MRYMHMTVRLAVAVFTCARLGAQALQLGSVNKRQSSGGFEMEPNGTEYVWAIEDVYEGQNFFE